MSSKSESASGGVGFFSLLTLLFIGLKLGHVINWSWWWVLSPLWLPFVVFLGALIVGLLIYVLVKLVFN